MKYEILRQRLAAFTEDPSPRNLIQAQQEVNRTGILGVRADCKQIVVPWISGNYKAINVAQKMLDNAP